MADNTAEVKITGDTSGAVDAIDKAASAAKSGTDGIIANFAKMHGETAASMSEFATAVKEASAKAGDALEGMNAGIEKINGTFALLGAVMTAGEIGEKFMEIGKEAAEFGEQISIASEKTGISTEDIQGLGFAATLSGSSMQAMVGALDKLALKLSEAGTKSSDTSRALGALGISMAEVKGKSPEAVLDLIAEKFHNTADGANKTAIAIALFGRAGADMIPLLNQGAAALEAHKEKAAELGITLSSETTEALKALSEQMKEQKAVSDSLWNTIGAQLTPVYTALSKAMEDSEKTDGQLRKSLELLPAVMKEISSLGSRLIEMFQQHAIVVGDLAAAMVAFAHDGPAGVRNALDMLGDDIDANHKKWETFREALEKPLALPKGFVGPPDDRPKVQPGAIGGAPGEDKSQMASYETELELEKVKYEKENDMRQMSLEQIRDYLVKVSNYADINAKDANLVARKVADETLEINKKALKDQTDLNNESIDATEKLGLAQISMGEQHAKSLYDQKKLTADQLLQIDLQYEQQRLNVEESALGQRLAMLQNDPSSTPAALKKVRDEMLLVQQQYLAKVQQLNDAAAKQDDKVWENSTKTMVQSFGSAFEGILTGSETWGQAMENIFKSLLNIVVGIGEQMAEKWIMDNVINTTTTEAAAKTGIAANASLAGSAAFASIAAIPIIGPGLAPEAAAAAYAGAMSFQIASASGGYDIPAGVNPLVQTHAKEMILPAGLADNVRNMTGGGGGDVHVHLNVQAVDSTGFDRVLKRNLAALSNAARSAYQRGHFSGV